MYRNRFLIEINHDPKIADVLSRNEYDFISYVTLLGRRQSGRDRLITVDEKMLATFEKTTNERLRIIEYSC